MKEFLLKIAMLLIPPIKRLVIERNKLIVDRGMFPSGHFYSPTPSVEDIRKRHSEIFALNLDLVGLDFDLPSQTKLLGELLPFYCDLPFQEQRTEGLRYFYENTAYSYSDAIFLYCMLRHLKPARYVEVGSGYSSALALDTDEHFLNRSTDFTFIEPYPKLLESLMSPEDSRHRIIATPVQDVPLEVFTSLERNDILFIDSTHVSKTGSDVNYLYLEVLPRLKPGVLIHVHDVFVGFEYPEDWVYGGMYWNEQYLLRALLIGSTKFKIRLMNTYLEEIQEDWFLENMPLCLRNRGGSIWLQVAD